MQDHGSRKACRAMAQVLYLGSSTCSNGGFPEEFLQHFSLAEGTPRVSGPRRRPRE